MIFSSEQTRNYIVAEQKQNNAPGTAYAADPAAIPVVTLTHGTKFHLDGQTIEVIHVPPAHTDGDLIVRFVEADGVGTRRARGAHDERRRDRGDGQRGARIVDHVEDAPQR